MSYAQNNEDVLLNRVFGGQQIGFYVDIGAYHPVEGSVTKAFYDRGWSGINIEPGSVFETLSTARPRDVNLRMAVMDRKGEVAFFEDPADRGMSHVTEATDAANLHSVPCDTLEAIIADHSKGRPIDFIKVDAEGAEAAIVRSTNWRQLRPRVLIFEATLPWSNVLANGEWEPGLLAAGYVRAYFDGINCFYVPEEEWPVLSQHFAVPVNVLDSVMLQGGELTALKAKADQLHEAYSIAAHNAEIFLAERDKARVSRDELRDQVTRASAERDEARASRDQLRDQVARISAELDSVISDRAAIAAELDKVFADRADIIAHREALYADIMNRQAASVVAVPMPTATPPEVETTPPPQLRWLLLRRLARRAYGLVRPFAKPVAWRLRGFFLGPTMIEIAAVQAQLRRLESEAGRAPPAVQSNLVPGDLHAQLVEIRRIVSTTTTTAEPSDLRNLTKAMEEALLTLAITAERRPLGAVAARPVTTGSNLSVALRLPGGRHADIMVGTADLSIGAALLASDGDWEPHVRRYLQAAVRDDWVCFDIGANLGTHTLSLASIATAGQIVAFEADPANFALLTDNIGALPPPHGLIIPVQVALWDSPGVLTIGGADELAGCSFVSADGIDAARTEDRLRMVVDANAIAENPLHMRLSQVRAMRLDDWVVERKLTRLDIIKLDVEGAEANVIRGAHETIRRFRPILLVEYNPHCAAAYFGQAADALYVELAQRFHAIHVLESDSRLTLVVGWNDLAARLANGKGYEDLVCIPGAEGQ